MKKNLAVLVIGAVALSGCAQFTTTQTQKDVLDAKGNATIRETSTTAKATTFAASKSALANWKATQTDKTQGASVGSLSQEGSTNSAAALGSLVELIRVLRQP